MPLTFEPPPFSPHPWLPGGHLQTIGALWIPAPDRPPARAHRVDLDDGDALMLHEDRPPAWQSGDPVVMLAHGLCGCHASGYMVRLADRFLRGGVRVFRMDLRGCGVGADLARQLSHAGRSDDLLAAIDYVAGQAPESPLGVVAVSLSGNQLLRGLGRIGAGLDSPPPRFEQLSLAMAVAPPIDLLRCATQLARLRLRPYNRYFVRQLLGRVPRPVREREDFRRALAAGKPTSLWELDDRLTAPLSGFRDARDYYRQAAAKGWWRDLSVKTLVLAASDDPIVPTDCFAADAGPLPPHLHLLISPRGGHVGFVGPKRRSWLEDVAAAWFAPFLRNDSETEGRSA